MKTLHCLLALTAVLLVGCSARESELPQDAAPFAAAAQDVADPASAAPEEAAGQVTATQTQNAPPPLSEEALLYAYDRAVEAYGWFDLATLPCGEESVTADGYAYQPVEVDGLDTLEDLRTYLASLFAQSVIDRLLPADQLGARYRDVNGRLCVRPASRGTDASKGAITVSAAQESESAWSVNVTVELLGEDLTTVTGLECVSFPYELVNGRWVFTEFDLIF